MFPRDINPDNGLAWGQRSFLQDLAEAKHQWAASAPQPERKARPMPKCPLRETCTIRIRDMSRQCGFEYRDRAGAPLWPGCPRYKRVSNDG